MKRAATVRGVVTHPGWSPPTGTLLAVTHPRSRGENRERLGISKRHSKGCTGRENGRCSCNAGWEASVFSQRDGKKIRKVFPTKAAASTWRADAGSQIEQGSLRAPTKTTLREAAEAWLRGAESGEIRNAPGTPTSPRPCAATGRRSRSGCCRSSAPRSSRRSPPPTCRCWSTAGRPEPDPASTIRNTIKPLQAIYRRAKSRGGLPVNPTRDLELPAAASPRGGDRLPRRRRPGCSRAVPAEDRLVWATALYAGLRYGELRALRWGAVDTAGGKIAVRESWDPKEGPIAPKTRTSRRTVPMPGLLRDLFLDRAADRRASSTTSWSSGRSTRPRSTGEPTRRGRGRECRSGCGSTRPATPTRAS